MKRNRGCSHGVASAMPFLLIPEDENVNQEVADDKRSTINDSNLIENQVKDTPM